MKNTATVYSRAWFFVVRMAFDEGYRDIHVSLRNPKTTLSFSTFLVAVGK